MSEKLTSLKDAMARVPSGSRISLGGSIMRRQPNAAVRELIRQGKTGFTAYTFSTSTGVDLLAAAGALARYEGIYVGLFWHGLAPNFRRAVEKGRVQVRDFSESSMVARFRASAMGASFMPAKAILGTDMARADASLIREIECPFTGETYVAMRAVEADFTIIHGYLGDRFGNVHWPLARDADDIDQLIARGAKRLIVTVEKIVEPEEICRTPNLTYIPGQWVEAIAEAPYGAHPTACDAFYDEDEEHLKAYIDASRTEAGSADYLQSYVRGLPSEEAYLEKVGGRAGLARLDVERTA